MYIHELYMGYDSVCTSIYLYVDSARISMVQNTYTFSAIHVGLSGGELILSKVLTEAGNFNITEMQMST